jgi:hypothetical protein
MPIAEHKSPGPEHLETIPETGSTARIKTAAPTPSRSVTTFMQWWMP